MCKVNNLYSMYHGSVIMNIEKMVEIGLLFEQYKELLTDKQREIVSLYYEEDYSLGEISENLNVSRQGVYDTLKRSEKILKDYENKLHLVEKIQEQEFRSRMFQRSHRTRSGYAWMDTGRSDSENN